MVSTFTIVALPISGRYDVVSHLDTMCLVGEYLYINVSVLWPWISLTVLMATLHVALMTVY